MLERGLVPDFSPAAIAEANALEGPALEVGPSVRDLRGLPWASIDNDDSRDLDQLTVAEPLPSGDVKVLVAIADVTAAVEIGSAIDSHARTNTTSVYTAAQVFPMLPERLSTDLTSLGEGEERLAMVMEIIVAKDGRVTGSDVYPALVLNRAKLAYDGVAAWLDGAAPPPGLSRVAGLDDQLRIQDRVAQAMRSLRHVHGALRLQTLEARPVFEGDELADLRPEEPNRAKELIEDFMIAANGATVKYLEAKGFASLRRVLHSPERWDRIRALAAALGKQLPPEPSSQALEEFLAERRLADPAGFPDLSLSELPGRRGDDHFGLAVRDYAHSTAPNRRYPDLATQRLLKAAMAGGPPPYRNEELVELARHCTEQEDNATKVERRVRKSAAAMLLASRIGEGFDGLVTGAGPKGTWVRIFRPPVEGKLMEGSEGLDVGDRIRVTLVRADVQRGFVDFARSGGQPPPGNPRPS